MSRLIPSYIEQGLRIEMLERAVIASEGDVEQLERKLVAARAEIVRLKGEAESWEKVFDRTCELLAEAKTALAEAIAKERERCALVCEEFNSCENIAQKCAAAIRKGK